MIRSALKSASVAIVLVAQRVSPHGLNRARRLEKDLTFERFVLVGDKILNNLDAKILKAIKSLSPTSFIGAVELCDKVKMDKKELGNRIMALKKSGKVDIVTKEFVSSMTLPNFITKVRLTEAGREALKKSRSTSKL